MKNESGGMKIFSHPPGKTRYHKVLFPGPRGNLRHEPDVLSVWILMLMNTNLQ